MLYLYFIINGNLYNICNTFYKTNIFLDLCLQIYFIYNYNQNVFLYKINLYLDNLN